MCNKDSKKDCVSYFVDSSCITEEINGKTITTQDISLSRNSVPQSLMADHFLSKFANKMRGPTPVSGQTHMHKAIFRDYL